MTAWRFLFLSLAVHLLLWFLLLNRPPIIFPKNNQAVEVAIIDKNERKEKQVVREALPPLSMLKPEPPKNPKYESEKDQNVKKEMKAQQSGLTQNGNSSINQPFKNMPSNPAGSGKQSSDQGDMGYKKNLARFMPGPNTNSPPTPSNNVMTANGEYLPDVSNGPITALNSERFIYYSFFSRIEERLRPLWERNVEYTVQRLPASTQKQLVNHNWITNLEVLIDAEGHYVDTIITQSSGIHEIDLAAVNAFSEAKFFPNPPPEMVKEDHRIHLNYAFIVQWGPGGWNRPF